MRKLAPIVLGLLAALALSACATPKKQKDLDDRLMQYEQMVRWSQWDAAANFIAPDYLQQHPISDLDMDRLRLFRVTSYTVRSATPLGDGNEFSQVVEIRLFNRNQATERRVMDRQLWRYNPEARVWMLESGLPDVLQRY